MLSKNSRNSLAAVSASLLMLQSASAAVTITDIKDIKPQDPNAGIYTNIVNNGAISLDRLGNFRPNETINKAAFLKAAMTYSGFKPTSSFNFYTGYSDVPEESWYAPYVKKALDIRALTNRLGDQFFPDQTLTRQEALLLAMSIFGIPTPLVQPSADDLYKDIRLTHPLASVYASAHNRGIYFEKDQEFFRPTRLLTRADAADLLFTAKLAAGLSSGEEGNPIIVPPVNSNNSDFANSEKFPLLEDAWDKIHSQYIYTDKIDENKLVYGAISGMVDTLDDPYSVFRAPNKDGDSYVYIPENYEGIGAVIELIDNNYTVQTTLNNSPAARSGLKTKDIITHIENKDISNLTADEVMGLIKGKSGTALHLTVKRGTQTLNFSITREKINVESIFVETLPNNINYVRIDQFTESTSDEFDVALENIKKSGSKKLIIDLRNNPGGYLTSTQSLLGHFIDKDQIAFYVEDKSGAQAPYNSEGDADLKDYKVVVLINEGSASASEITAGALQDYGIAYLIGTTSFGKGSVQEITAYQDNSTLKITIAKWLTPKKRSINHIGVVPDQTVKITDAQKADGQDPQLDAAKNYLN